MLLLVSTVTLAVGGVGIMNIMLATVRSRIREIGIRKALGATAREIKLQFLIEAVFISLAGGAIGALFGIAVPDRHRSLHRLPHPIFLVVGSDLAGHVDAGRRDLRNPARQPRRPDGSRRVAEVRVSH